MKAERPHYNIPKKGCVMGTLGLGYNQRFEL